jgi:ubiquinone/menaquinone biosynthesis C-methylase UbiE
MVDLPYFDIVLEQLRLENQAFKKAFGRHVHWGLWDDPSKADGTVEDFVQASERLCQRVCDASRIRDGMDVLDVGCGFGGTIASLNERFHSLSLTGLNIDERQLERARAEVKPSAGNRVSFVEGDACKLPFEASSFDVVLAVECIFHFPDRQQFLTEARRVLRPGGRLALSDITLAQEPIASLKTRIQQIITQGTYGQGGASVVASRYAELASKAGLKIVEEEDVSHKILPTYAFVESLFAGVNQGAVAATGLLREQAESGQLRYVILAFD